MPTAFFFLVSVRYSISSFTGDADLLISGKSKLSEVVIHTRLQAKFAISAFFAYPHYQLLRGQEEGACVSLWEKRRKTKKRVMRENIFLSRFSRFSVL